MVAQPPLWSATGSNIAAAAAIFEPVAFQRGGWAFYVHFTVLNIVNYLQFHAFESLQIVSAGGS